MYLRSSELEGNVLVYCVLQSVSRKNSCFGKACQNLHAHTQESSKLLLLLQFVHISGHKPGKLMKTSNDIM